MANWAVKYEQLDDEQKSFVNSEDTCNHNWIVGFPGSGKSILLVHKIRHIRNNEPGASIALVVFTKALEELFSEGFRELGVSGVSILTMYQFFDPRKPQRRYDYIFCDEVQDFTKEILEDIRARANKQVFVAGDPNQSIYEKDVRYGKPTLKPDEPGVILKASKHELNTIYRLTRSVISAIGKFFPRMNILNAKNDSTKQDVNIRLCKSSSPQGQISYIDKQVSRAIKVKKSCAILLPTHESVLDFVNGLLEDNGEEPWEIEKNRWGKPDYDSLNSYLEEVSMKYLYVGSGYGSLEDVMSGDYAAIMTYASSKGLDFDYVFLPFADSSLFISNNPEISRTQFMVAMTRSKEQLYITYTGNVCKYVSLFEKDTCCSHINCNNPNRNNQVSSASNPFGF